MYLYHYTTEEGAESIKEDMQIDCSERHEHFGAGVYFTAFAPQRNSQEDIARNNYNNGKDGIKEKTYVALLPDLIFSLQQNKIHLNQTPII